MKDFLIAMLEGEVILALVYVAIAVMLFWAIAAPDGLAFVIAQAFR